MMKRPLKKNEKSTQMFLKAVPTSCRSPEIEVDFRLSKQLDNIDKVLSSDTMSKGKGKTHHKANNKEFSTDPLVIGPCDGGYILANNIFQDAG